MRNKYPVNSTHPLPESSPLVSEPFEEEKMITVYRECPSEVKTLFTQTIVKPEHHFESLSLPINVSVMVVEVQWACSILSQFIGLDNDKFVVEVMLGFLLTFFCQSLVSRFVSVLKSSLLTICTNNW
jgi:hypothetical protein